MTFCLTDLFCFDITFYDSALFIYFPLLTLWFWIIIIVVLFLILILIITNCLLQTGYRWQRGHWVKTNDSTTSVRLVDNISKSTLISHWHFVLPYTWLSDSLGCYSVKVSHISLFLYGPCFCAYFSAPLRLTKTSVCSDPLDDDNNDDDDDDGAVWGPID